MIKFLMDFQTLIAGVLAIGAGWLAYRGAIQQAKISMQIENARTTELKRVTAVALWAELAQCNAMMTLEAKNLAMNDDTQVHWRLAKGVATPVFDSNPGAIGLLSAGDAYMTSAAYATIKMLDDHCRYLTVDGRRLSGEYRNHVALNFRASRLVIDQAMKGLSTTAGLSEATLAMVMSMYDKLAAGEDFGQYVQNNIGH